jgi:hypothetical protein
LKKGGKEIMSKEDKIISILCGIGIFIIIFIWIWVFKWGVPLIKSLK